MQIKRLKHREAMTHTQMSAVVGAGAKVRNQGPLAPTPLVLSLPCAAHLGSGEWRTVRNWGFQEVRAEEGR